MDRAPAIRALIVAVDRYLARSSGEAERVAEVRGRLAACGDAPIEAMATGREPACGFLDAALAASDAADIAAAIGAAAPYLRWETYSRYPAEEIGARWLANHAMVSLVAADDFELGLFLMAPRTLYRDHHHLAPELYVPITGPHDWRFAPGGEWTRKPAHAPVWNEPNAIHATLVREAPFLCLYAWTRDVGAPAKVDFAPDWAAIEAGL